MCVCVCVWVNIYMYICTNILMQKYETDLQQFINAKLNRRYKYFQYINIYWINYSVHRSTLHSYNFLRKY